MTRKCLTSLLALMLALLLPFCALADTQHTLTVIPGDIFASEEAISDLLDVLSLTLTTGEESGALSVELDGEDILNVAVKAEESGLYVYSNLLSDDVLYITWEDGIAILTQLMTAEMSADEAKIFQKSMEQMQTGMTAMQPKSAATMTPEAGIEQARKLYADDPGMLEWIENLYGKMVIEEGEFASPDRDTATQKWTMVMTSEDFVAICDTNLMRSTVEETVKAQYPELKGEELTEAVDQMVEEVREMYRQMDIHLTMTMYTVDDGMTTVGVEMDFPMTLPVSETEKESAFLGLTYNRLTDNNGVSHKAGMTMSASDKDVLEASFDLYKGADGVSTGMLGMLVDGTQLTVMYNASTEGDIRTRCADVYLRSGASAIIEPAASERPIIGFQLVTGPADGALLDPIEKANSSSAVNVMKLSENELGSLMTDVESRAMQIVFAAMSKLPPSVLRLLTESMN